MTSSLNEDHSSIPLRIRSQERQDCANCTETEHLDLEPLIAQNPEDGEPTAGPSTLWKMLQSAGLGNCRMIGSLVDHNNRHQDRSFTKRWWLQKGMSMGLIVLLLLGVFQLLSLSGNLVGLLGADPIHKSVGSEVPPSSALRALSHWPTDLTKNIFAKRCHSHNDYWREVPLYSAIEVGCIGVEADVWLSSGQLYVGHSIASLTPNRTLTNLYINPLLDILSKQNQKGLILPDHGVTPHGIFDTDPGQTLVLLVDFKTDGTILFPHLVSALEPLRSKHYLTYRNGTEISQGPITVVGTGNAPFDAVTSDVFNPHHDIFFDAPLDQLSERLINETARTSFPRQILVSSRDVERVSYNFSHCYYASVSFKKAFGEYHDDELSMEQLSILRDQVRGAHRLGLKARYWELPYWPIHVRNRMWEVLMREGVDVLNVDDLKAAADRDWTLPGE